MCTCLSGEQDHSKQLLLMLILSRMEVLQHEKLGIFWECGGQLGETSEFWWPQGEATEPWKSIVPQWGA